MNRQYGQRKKLVATVRFKWLTRYRTDKPGSPTLPSGGIQQLFEEAESDVLLLYDSCHSSHPAVNVAGQGVTEVIAACRFETQAPAVGVHSFTNALILELELAFTGPPISVAELHGRIIGQLKSWKPGLLRDRDGNIWTDTNRRPRYECHKRRTPVHCFLTNESPYRSIMLGPLPPKLSHAAVANIEQAESSQRLSQSSPEASFANESRDITTSTAPTTISDSSKCDKEPRVLLTVRLEDDGFLDDIQEDGGKRVQEWCDWLKAIPEGAKHISIQGVYKSFSTLVIISMPCALWNTLPDNSAYSFVGFVTSDNLDPSCSIKVPVKEATIGTHEKSKQDPSKVHQRDAQRIPACSSPITEGKYGSLSR